MPVVLIKAEMNKCQTAETAMRPVILSNKETGMAKSNDVGLNFN